MLKKDPSAEGGARAPRAGEIMRNPELARTFRTLAAEGKAGFYAGRVAEELVRVVRGAVFDVAVDIRQSSPTFGRWVGVVLSEDNQRQLWIPPGFAHGFLTLSDSADFLYKTTDYYSPEHERCIAWDDPAIGVQWPGIGGAPLLSAKDQQAPTLAEAREQGLLPTIEQCRARYAQLRTAAQS